MARVDVGADARAADSHQGLPFILQRQTLVQFPAQWLDDSVRLTVRPSTFRRYSNNLQLHL